MAINNAKEIGEVLILKGAVINAKDIIHLIYNSNFLNYENFHSFMEIK